MGFAGTPIREKGSEWKIILGRNRRRMWTVNRLMQLGRIGRVGIAALGAMAFTPLLTVAQQQPIQGCGTAISCRPLGFSTNGPSGTGSMVFGVAAGFDPGFKLSVIGMHTIVIAPRPTSAVERGRLFRLGVSLLPPTPAPTPVPTPPPTPAPSNRGGAS